MSETTPVPAPAPVRPRSGRLARIGGALLTTLMALTLIIFVAMTVLRVSGGELLAIRTGSMSPTMEPGDLLVSRDVDPRTVRRGDVITFRVPSADNTLVTHRVTAVADNGNTFTTKGDANDTEDPFTTAADDVLGTKWFSIPGVGRVMVFLSSGLGTALLILVPGGIYLGQTYADRRRAAAEAAGVAQLVEPSVTGPTVAETPTPPPFVWPAFVPPAPNWSSSAPPPSPPTPTCTHAAAAASPPVIIVQVPQMAAPVPGSQQYGPLTSGATPLAVPVDQLPPEISERLGTQWALMFPLDATVSAGSHVRRDPVT